MKLRLVRCDVWAKHPVHGLLLEVTSFIFRLSSNVGDCDPGFVGAPMADSGEV